MADGTERARIGLDAMAQPKRGGESLTLDGGRLGSLHFEWSQDRYAHAWKFADGATSLNSMESDNSLVWPSSPPLQQIHQQSFADGRQVVFGVGMAGRGHWSASFTLVPDLECWIVELACRSAVQPESLHSTYKLCGDWQQIHPHGFSSPMASQSPSPRIELEAIVPSSQAQLSEQVIRIQPVHIEKASTTQWAFRLRIHQPHSG